MPVTTVQRVRAGGPHAEPNLAEPGLDGTGRDDIGPDGAGPLDRRTIALVGIIGLVLATAGATLVARLFKADSVYAAELRRRGVAWTLKTEITRDS